MEIFRKLNADEIEARVAQIGKGWAQLLLYKNARVDMSILDETVGPERWQREHYECKGNLFCRVGIRIEKIDSNGNFKEEWVWKSDCGTESNTEKEKGEASDSFKRACTNWGIGRELYTSPVIFINTETTEFNGKYKLANSKERYSVASISYDGNKIDGLEIQNQDGKIVFSSKPKAKPVKNEVIEPIKNHTNNDDEIIPFEASSEKHYKRVKRGE